jgi:hypothetical protein
MSEIRPLGVKYMKATSFILKFTTLIPIFL